MRNKSSQQRFSEQQDYIKQQQQQQMDPQPAAQPCRQTAVTLAFKDPSVERRFKRWYDDAATAHDLQAASIYLWMVALGSLLYLVIIAYSPSSRPANLDQCTVLILCSWMGPMMHLLLLLRLLPRATYTRHRTHIILLFRAFYIGATSVNGFGLCGVGPLAEKKGAVAAAFHGTPYTPAPAGVVGLGEPGGLGDASNSSSNRCPLESPFSAMLWRSGVIGLIWWPAAFPLPFRHHVPVQAASVALYISTLAPTVCSTMHGVRSGRAVLAAIRGFGDAFTTQLLSAMGVPGPPARHTADVAAAAASGSSSSGGCVPVLAYVQVVLGLVLPAFVVYCFEARKRHSWWHDALSSSNNSGGTAVGTSSSGGGSSGSNAAAVASLAAEDAAADGSNASLAKLEAAAVAAMAAAADGWDVGLGLYTRKSPAAAAAVVAGDTGHGDVDRREGSVIHRDHSNTSSIGSAGSSSNSNNILVGRVESIVSRDGSGSSSSSSSAQLVPASDVTALRQRKGNKGHTDAAAAAADSALEEAALLAAVDSWEAAHGSKCGCCGSSRGPPPGVTDFFVLLVVLGLSWVVLGQVLQ